MEDIEIIARNLLDAEALLSEGWLLRYAQGRELAGLLLSKQSAADSDDPAAREALADSYREFARCVREGRAAKKADSDGYTDEKDGFSALLNELDLHGRIDLAREWASVADPIPLERCEPKDGSAYTVAHFGNLYADCALTAFSRALGSAVTLPCEDYAAACEEVSDGNADFCILPLESSGDGVMNRFEQMIDRYSLFTLLTCSVSLSVGNEHDDDAQEWIRFALLAASPCRLEEACDRMHLRITPEGESLWELLLAAELLSATLLECRLSVGTSDRTDGGSGVYHLTFLADEACRSGLLAYLELGYSGYTLTGIYRSLPDQPLEG